MLSPGLQSGLRPGALRVRGIASAVGASAGTLRAAASVDWQSTAARQWRLRLADDVARLHRAAAEVDAAALALLRHADSVEAAARLARAALGAVGLGTLP